MDKLEIVSLGSKGDGIADNGRFVPFALPGERVEFDAASSGQKAVKILRASPHRIEPLCQYFGHCGGCALQHLEPVEYLKWKRREVVDAFAQHDLTPEIDPCLPTGIASRRRATFSTGRTGDGLAFGFIARKSHEIIDIEDCPLLLPEIPEHMNDLRQLAGLALPAAGQLKMSVLACSNGLDIALDGQFSLSERRRKAIIDWAVAGHKVRVSFGDEVIIETVRPVLSVAGINVTPPVGGFAQAVSEAEQHMVQLVAQHLKKSRRIVDLYSGFGTFALNLVNRSIVHAVEYEEPALASLNNAVNFMTGNKTLTTEQRDLDRRPLLAGELEKFAGAVFDPPRAGAEAQVRELAKSELSRIAAISCNPTTLARDARILVDAGFTITKVVPVDQFLFSPHVEVVALFERKKVRAKRPIFG